MLVQNYGLVVGEYDVFMPTANYVGDCVYLSVLPSSEAYQKMREWIDRRRHTNRPESAIAAACPSNQRAWVLYYPPGRSYQGGREVENCELSVQILQALESCDRWPVGVALPASEPGEIGWRLESVGPPVIPQWIETNGGQLWTPAMEDAPRPVRRRIQTLPDSGEI